MFLIQPVYGYSNCIFVHGRKAVDYKVIVLQFLFLIFVTILFQVKEFEDQSLKKQWYSSSNFAERLVHLTSDLCKESMSGSAMVTPDYWNLVGMAFETDSDDSKNLSVVVLYEERWLIISVLSKVKIFSKVYFPRLP